MRCYLSRSLLAEALGPSVRIYRLPQRASSDSVASQANFRSPEVGTPYQRCPSKSRSLCLSHRSWSTWHNWSTKTSHPLLRAAAVAVETEQISIEEAKTAQSSEAGSLQPSKQLSAGAFQRIPQVPAADDHLKAALRKASRIVGNKKIKGRLQHTRNLSARKLDALTKEIATPLGAIVRAFPACAQLHPFEKALLDLTIGIEDYEKRLEKLNNLRKSCLEVGKSFAGKANKGTAVKDVTSTLEDGFKSLEALYSKNIDAVEAVKSIAITLRKLPTVDIGIPTVALVGAPNVGKSSLVQLLSSGLPEICNYPFTTRTVKMGHFYVDGKRHQVTDTPGLLNRGEEDRNKMEFLTLACLEHLPTSVVFVMDLTGDCGTKLEDQWQIRQALTCRFPQKAWLDVFSKADILQPVFSAVAQASPLSANPSASSESVMHPPESAVAMAKLIPHALRVSSTEHLGIGSLKENILRILS